MAVQSWQSVSLDCRTPEGRLVATLEIIATKPAATTTPEEQPLVTLTTDDAFLNSEEPIQLRERSRYEYRLNAVSQVDSDFALMATRIVQPSKVEMRGEDRGVIEPLDYCGLLSLVVIRRGDPNERPIANANVEVRSIKIGYRQQYRQMLEHIADKCSGLLLDCRAPTRLHLNSMWLSDARICEQQLEFLRHTVSSSSFRAAIDQVLHNPHRRIESDVRTRDITRGISGGKDLARQIAISSRRVALPASHPLRDTVASLPTHISVRLRKDYLDTAENRFAKLVLVEFRNFLMALAANLALRNTASQDNQRLLRECKRLVATLESQLSRGFFPDIGESTVLPLGSPVIQRKEGYRELLRYWLQFHAGAQLIWEGGPDVFHAGCRDVATLYEYWLFFQLESLFREKFRCDQPLHAVVIDKNAVPPRLVLKRGVELQTPISGSWSESARRNLRAEFHFNRKFVPHADSQQASSWTRGVQPDYTLSLWPSDYSKETAEANELMVHVHFDAKYRVEQVSEIIGDERDDLASPLATDRREMVGVAKYADLLKMHAYRDAIRRTAGAYVIYPGTPLLGNKQYQGFHEIVPGLGAFAVRPGDNGRAVGIEAISSFLDEVVTHCGDRATARERVSFHVNDAYGKPLNVRRRSATEIPLHERDPLASEKRAVPPAEEAVLVVKCKNVQQCTLAEHDEGMLFIMLDQESASESIDSRIGSIRHILLRSDMEAVESRLVEVRKAGFQIVNRTMLLERLITHPLGPALDPLAAVIQRESEGIAYLQFLTRKSSHYQSNTLPELAEVVGRRHWFVTSMLELLS